MHRNWDTVSTRISHVVSQFFKSRFNPEPTEIRMILQNEMVILRIKGIISKAETDKQKVINY
ncbi:MAG: Na-translocating system protein MpsC family protein [Thermodesulfobacteriota bacterium]|nr:Na-translocating system protein MpsC family protein [Thermodesulfobacteriota bacterium]